VVRQAKRGVRVVRLMTGDPFVYASGPEEAAACAKVGIGFEIVPGVSSAAAVPAYAGIPLTTKDHREVTVVTAGDKIDWSRYADARTLVLLSAVNCIGDIAKALVAAGRDPETPVAMTRTGTTTDQQTVTSTLAHIAADARAARLSSRQAWPDGQGPGPAGQCLITQCLPPARMPDGIGRSIRISPRRCRTRCASASSSS